MLGTRRNPVITPYRLAPHVLLLTWEQGSADPTRPSQVEIDGKVVGAPVARLETLTDDGAMRHMMAIAWPADAPIADVRFLYRGETQARTCEAKGGGLPDAEFEAAALLERLPDPSRVRVVVFLLETCRTIFQLDGVPTFAAHMRQLVDRVFASQGAIHPCASINDELVLWETQVPADIGTLVSAILIGPGSVRRAPLSPFVDDRTTTRHHFSAFLVARPAPIAADGTIVLVGKAGLLARRWASRRVLPPSIVDFLVEHGEDRRAAAFYVFECLSKLAATDDTAAMLARDVGRIALGPRSRGDRTGALGLAIECCVATEAGLFLAGRLVDRCGVVHAIDIRGAGFESQIAVENLVCLRESRGDAGVLDFMALAVSPDGPPTSGIFHASVRLVSGLIGLRTAVPATVSGIDGRSEILKSLPPHAASRLIERVVGPAIHGLPAKRGVRPAGRGEVIEFGNLPTEPHAALVMPLGKDRGALLAKAATFFLDPVLRDVEIVFVLDRAAARGGAERALASLWATFGLPSRLALVPPSDHRAETLERGISEARCNTILFLDEGVLPEQPGWAQALIEGLNADPRVALCGGRLLNPDGSIRSAGLALVDGEDGNIALEAEFAGFPREFPAAMAAQRKVAMSLAMCALRREALNEVGGLSCGYLTEAWNDADFCARLRRANWDVAYAHRAAAVCVAAPHHPTGLGMDNAARIDAWRFVQDWSKTVSADTASSSNARVRALDKARPARPRARSRSAA